MGNTVQEIVADTLRRPTGDPDADIQAVLDVLTGAGATLGDDAHDIVERALNARTNPVDDAHAICASLSEGDSDLDVEFAATDSDNDAVATGNGPGNPHM